MPIEIKKCRDCEHFNDGFEDCDVCIHLGNWHDYFIPKKNDTNQDDLKIKNK